jgi:predicted dienelactone hydrolase
MCLHPAVIRDWQVPSGIPARPRERRFTSAASKSQLSRIARPSGIGFPWLSFPTVGAAGSADTTILPRPSLTPGFVAVAINHPGENAFDQSRIDELFFFTFERPADTKRLIDFMLDAWPNAHKLDRERVGHFGFSRGGYTSLAVIGGTPDPRRGAGRCPRDLNTGQCESFRKNEVVRDRTSTHDPRVKAAVIADPGPTFLFGPGDLKDIRIPVQLWSSGRGGRGVTPESVASVRHALPADTEYRVVENAGHFAFLAPCNALQAQSIPEICTDAAGFDREAFHKSFNTEVVRFFRTHLVDNGRP